MALCARRCPEITTAHPRQSSWLRMDEYRELLLAVKRGEVAWQETEQWRLSLHREFEQAVEQTNLPERPDYEKANELLINAWRYALER